MATEKKPNLKDIFNKYSASRENTFKEYTGGGTPIPKGEKLEDHPEIHRVQQPRDEEGQFTYNAVNNKPLKYGPSRGKTIPPLLKGMKIKFAEKKNDAVVLDGLTYIHGLDFTKEELIERLSDFTIDGENGKVIWNNLPDSELKRKKGRKSQEEKEMIKNNESGFTKTDTTLDYGNRRKPEFVKPKPKPPVAPQGNGGGKPNTPQQPQQTKIDTDLAKSDPVAFGNKYQKEISNIKKLDPKISESKIINAFASGKIESFDDLEYAISLKGKGIKPEKPNHN